MFTPPSGSAVMRSGHAHVIKSLPLASRCQRQGHHLAHGKGVIKNSGHIGTDKKHTIRLSNYASLIETHSRMEMGAKRRDGLGVQAGGLTGKDKFKTC